MIPSLRQEIDDGPAAVIFLLAQLVLVADIVIYPIFSQPIIGHCAKSSRNNLAQFRLIRKSSEASAPTTESQLTLKPM